MGFLDFLKKKKDTVQKPPAPPAEQAEAKQRAMCEIVEQGYNYLYESAEWQSFYATIAEVLPERPCICITGKNPDKIRVFYNIKWAHMIWVTSIETELKSATPERIEFELTQNVLNFMKNNNGSAVFVDDVEFLTVMAGFEKVMDFLKALGDTSAYTSSSVVVHICPGFFSSTEVSLLKSIFDRTIPPRSSLIETRDATSYLTSRLPYPKLADLVNGFGGPGRKLIISLVQPDKLKPFFGEDNDYYFITNTEQKIPVVRPWATETDFIIALKKYTESGGKTAVIDGLECVYSSVDFKRFLSFVKDLTDIASRENIKIFCVFNEGMAKKTDTIALKQRFDVYVSQ
ncbi:MAG: DUF835 domain-containing protein [Thermoplasmata archaeon]|nr:DUF835 domain-containing protein [Thermoplasmata archaeon]